MQEIISMVPVDRLMKISFWKSFAKFVFWKNSYKSLHQFGLKMYQKKHWATNFYKSPKSHSSYYSLDWHVGTSPIFFQDLEKWSGQGLCNYLDVHSTAPFFDHRGQIVQQGASSKLINFKITDKMDKFSTNKIWKTSKTFSIIVICLNMMHDSVRKDKKTKSFNYWRWNINKHSVKKSFRLAAVVAHVAHSAWSRTAVVRHKWNRL